MSREPSNCSDCSTREINVEHPQSRISQIKANFKVSLNPNISLATPLNIIRNPNEVEDESRCANPTCSKGQAEIRESLRTINRGLERAARTGDWTGVDKHEVERLQQLGEGALENVDDRGTEWPNNERRNGWNDIEDEFDTLEEKLSDAQEYTQQLYSQSGAGIKGQENISEITDALDTLNELEDRTNKTEVVADEDTTITESNGEEQQGLEDRVQELEDELQEEKEEKQELRDELQEERDEKEGLRDELQEERDEKQKQRDEKLNLREENLDQKEEIQNLRAKVQQLENERESEAEVEDTPERDDDGKEKAADSGVTASGGDNPPPSPGASTRESEEATQSSENGSNTASAMANGGGGTEVGESATSSTGDDSATTNGSTTDSEQSDDRAVHRASNNGAQPDTTQSPTDEPEWVEDSSIQPGPDPEFYEKVYGERPPEHLRRDDADRPHANDGLNREDESTEKEPNAERDDDFTPAGRG